MKQYVLANYMYFGNLNYKSNDKYKIFHLIKDGSQQSLEKNWIPACPLEKQPSNFACPGHIL